MLEIYWRSRSRFGIIYHYIDYARRVMGALDQAAGNDDKKQGAEYEPGDKGYHFIFVGLHTQHPTRRIRAHIYPISRKKGRYFIFLLTNGSFLCRITTMNKLTIPEKIKAIRNKRRLTQREMAVIIGLTRQKIADYEGGRSKISAEDWEKIQALSKKK